MSELIKTEVNKTQEHIKQVLNKAVSDDRAFSYTILEYVFGVDFVDQDDLVTDGPNDGGIDFVYYDEEEAKVILCQSKYTDALQFDDAINEFEKMHSTLLNFKQANTGMYNDRLRKTLQNALDRLPEESTDNVELNLFTTANVDVNALLTKISNTTHNFASDAVKIYVEEDIEKEIRNVLEALDKVSYEKIKIDRPRNILEYESNTQRGIMCNVLSTSLISLFNKYAGQGLFDLNIRKYIRNTLVDTGIKETLEKDRENFWFLNNGIIIACKDYDVDGDTVKLYDFSIVNGGQTTTLISTYKGKNSKEFYIPCKIVSTKYEDPSLSFFTRIAETTNSQKPIYARDLKSNSPEMVSLAKLLKSENVFLEIKRGVKQDKIYRYSIKNDELAQIILSFAFQRPGTSRSGKKAIFESPDLYAQLFKANYFGDAGRKGFLLDIIDLFDRYSMIEKEYKESNELEELELELLKNGRQVIFALFGVVYRLVNGDISEKDLRENPSQLKSVPFIYSSFLSNYKEDDVDSKLKRLIRDIVREVTASYRKAYDNNQVTSVSNFLKTDSKYLDEIVFNFGQDLDYPVGDDIKQVMDIFKRV